MNCGRSAGVRDEIRLPSTTTGLSSHSRPAFTRSSLMAPTLVPRLPRTMPAEIGTQPAWQMKATGLSGLVDLAGELEQLLRAAHDVGRVAAGNHQAVELVGAEIVHAGVDGERIAALALVGLLAGAGHDGAGAFLLQADLGIPELEVFVEGPAKKRTVLP